jgi:hypothetical protein
MLLLLEEVLLLALGLSTLSTLTSKELLDLLRNDEGLEVEIVCLATMEMLSCSLQAAEELCLLLLLQYWVVAGTADAGTGALRLLRLMEARRLRYAAVSETSVSLL